MRTADDSKTIDMFPPEARVVRHVTREDRDEQRKLREERETTKHEARRWVVVQNPGTEDEDVWDHARFGTFHEALRSASACHVKFDVMFRLPDGSLTTEF